MLGKPQIPPDVTGGPYGEGEFHIGGLPQSGAARRSAGSVSRHVRGACGGVGPRRFRNLRTSGNKRRNWSGRAQIQADRIAGQSHRVCGGSRDIPAIPEIDLLTHYRLMGEIAPSRYRAIRKSKNTMRSSGDYPHNLAGKGAGQSPRMRRNSGNVGDRRAGVICFADGRAVELDAALGR